MGPAPEVQALSAAAPREEQVCPVACSYNASAALSLHVTIGTSEAVVRRSVSRATDRYVVVDAGAL